jgi:type III secretory pathway component EscS
LVSYETNQFCTTSFLQGNGKVLKRDWFIIVPFTNTKDAMMRNLFFSTGTIGIGLAVAALIAWSQAVTPLQATTASWSINPTNMMATYKAPLPIEQWEAI